MKGVISMRILFLIVLYLCYEGMIRLINKKFADKSEVCGFQKMSILAPVKILFVFLVIQIIGLTHTQSGFTLGDVSLGVKTILFLGLPLALLSGGLIFLIPKENLKEVTYGSKGDGWHFLYVWIMVGPVEELLYRGFVQGTLTTMLDGHLFAFSYATILTSVFFVFIHLNNVFSKTETMAAFLGMLPMRLFAALILGYSFQVSGSLVYPIIIHNLLDGINFSVLYFRKSSIGKNKDTFI